MLPPLFNRGVFDIFLSLNMPRFLALILVAVLMVGCAAEPEVPDVSPREFWVAGPIQLKYAVTGQYQSSPMRGVNGELVWWQNGYGYDAQLTFEVLRNTILNQRSTGRIGPSGIEPEKYSEGRKDESITRFLRDQEKIVFSSNAPSAQLRGGAQDRLSVMMQLGAILKANPARYPSGALISIQTAGLRDAGVWVFVIGEDEKMTLPVGEIVVRKLTRSSRSDVDNKLELWLAPTYGYLPARFRQTRANGDFADAQLRAVPATKAQ